jgi:DNA-binding response OmpR family regulator
MVSGQQKRILVIEDDEDIRTVVVTRLTRAGYDTSVAVDGKDGLRRFYGDRPDLVVLDIAMPVMDGWQVWIWRRRIRGQAPGALKTCPAKARFTSGPKRMP